MSSDVKMIEKFIDTVKEKINNPAAEIKTGYEAGCLDIIYIGNLLKKEMIVIYLTQEL